MRLFAHELSSAVHSLGGLEALSVKVASADSCVQAQNAVAAGCSHLYNVMYKRALADTVIGPPAHVRVVGFLDKVAAVLDKEPIPTDMRYKLAAAVLADSALSVVMENSSEYSRNKYAEAQAYGREFVVELLRKVI